MRLKYIFQRLWFMSHYSLIYESCYFIINVAIFESLGLARCRLYCIVILPCWFPCHQESHASSDENESLCQLWLQSALKEHLATGNCPWEMCPAGQQNHQESVQGHLMSFVLFYYLTEQNRNKKSHLEKSICLLQYVFICVLLFSLS